MFFRHDIPEETNLQHIPEFPVSTAPLGPPSAHCSWLSKIKTVQVFSALSPFVLPVVGPNCANAGTGSKLG